MECKDQWRVIVEAGRLWREGKHGFVQFFFPQIWITASRLSLQHKPLTEEYIYKPLNMTDIQSALLHPNCMCLKSNRKKSGLFKKKKGRVCSGKKFDLGKDLIKRLHLLPLKQSSFGKKRKRELHHLEYRELIRNDIFLGGKSYFSQV